MDMRTKYHRYVTEQTQQERVKMNGTYHNQDLSLVILILYVNVRCDLFQQYGVYV